MDTPAVSVVANLRRLARYIDLALSKTFAPFDLNTGEFDALAALRRAGPPATLTPTELSNQLLLSSGAMTNRIDRLESAGLVTREPDPDDRRGVRVALTAKGSALIDAAMAAAVTKNAKIVGTLSEEELAAAADLLRRLLLYFEEEPTGLWRPPNID